MKCANHPETDASGACVYCGKLFCQSCLVEVNGKNYCKGDISNILNEAKQQVAAVSPSVVINNSNNNVNTNTNTNINTNNMGTAYQQKSKITALILCILLGLWGIHRFYVGKAGTGIIWLFTGGFFFVGWIFDIVLILTGSFRDKAGMPLK